MRSQLSANEAVLTAVDLVNKEIDQGLSPAVALSVVAGRNGIEQHKLEYFYNLYGREPVAA